jgi:hypothetical protein
MAMSKEENEERVAAISDAYSTHTEGKLKANEELNKEREKAEKDSDLESVDQPLPEEQRFVGNPDDLRKDVASEEEFSEGLKDGKDTTGETKSTSKRSKS